MHKFDFAEEAVLGSARRAYNEGCADFEVVSKKCVLLVMDTEPALVEISC